MERSATILRCPYQFWRLSCSYRPLAPTREALAFWKVSSQARAQIKTSPVCADLSSMSPDIALQILIDFGRPSAEGSMPLYCRLHVYSVVGFMPFSTFQSSWSSFEGHTLKFHFMKFQVLWASKGFHFFISCPALSAMHAEPSALLRSSDRDRRWKRFTLLLFSIRRCVAIFWGASHLTLPIYARACQYVSNVEQVWTGEPD